jgi:hypothetical protein
MILSEIVTHLDRDQQSHLARILLLLHVFDDPQKGASVEGITKLAKLDFLLRYPTYFERAMKARNVGPEKVQLQDYERKTVEAEMVRYRFGPWDHRYRQFLNVLTGLGLVNIETTGNTVLIALTLKGKDRASQLAESHVYQPLLKRAELLKKYLNLRPTEIMKFIYKTFPEISSLAMDEKIKP